MAFMKYAAATVVHPNVSRTEWANIRVSGKGLRVVSGVPANLIERASAFFGTEFDPRKYLLTHATIIASVDTYGPPGVKTGAVLEDGFRVNRKFADYRVKTDSDKYINNNLDCWSRPVLLAAYPTFVGGHNFVEHVQVEELSKGRIIDAVARDIGDTIYVDILIATDRKHKDLVAAIENGKMGTLSMGCTVDGTICTKCGHWAADETEMCPHVKYSKGNSFYDEQGLRHRVAELCGHESIGPTGGVQFIEASWVATPAFTGAVLRNVIESPSEAVVRQAAKVLASPPPEWSAESMAKAARQRTGLNPVVVRAGNEVEAALQHDHAFPAAKQPPITIRGNVYAGLDPAFAGWMDEGGGEGGDAPAAPEAPKKDEGGPFKSVEDEVYGDILNRVKQRLKNDLAGPKVDEALAPSMAPNDNMVKEGSLLIRAAMDDIVRTAKSDVELVDRVASYHQRVGVRVPVEVYRAALKVGRHDQYRTAGAFWKACNAALGRTARQQEVRFLARLGSMLSRRGSPAESDAPMAVVNKEKGP